MNFIIELGNKKHCLVISNTKSSGVIHNRNYSNEVTSASMGFCAGVKREIPSLVRANILEKKCVIIHNISTKLDSMLEKKTEKSKQKMSLSSVSGGSLITGNTSLTSIIGPS